MSKFLTSEVGILNLWTSGVLPSDETIDGGVYSTLFKCGFLYSMHTEEQKNGGNLRFVLKCSGCVNQDLNTTNV